MPLARTDGDTHSWGAGFMFRGGPTCQPSLDGKGNGHMSITTALETQRRRLEENEKGFTLIELLVVVL
ncbi:MAG: prepilin-type N-terminal cleavage/methylation domain-containing protein, partial [Microbacteriaceae bacterium]|nr:prepilin-type N-terminal cleavage/methylation domain-containing protein [Microbacteriaceae bacterium]